MMFLVAFAAEIADVLFRVQRLNVAATHTRRTLPAPGKHNHG